MHHLDQRKRSCVRVWDPRKLHVSVYENAQTIVSWLMPLSKVFTTRMRSLLPYSINTQRRVPYIQGVCAIHTQIDTNILIYKNTSKHHPIFMKISGIANTYMRNMFITKNRPWQPQPPLGEAGTWCRASWCPPLGCWPWSSWWTWSGTLLCLRS